MALLSALIVSFTEGNPASIVIIFKVLVDLFLFFLAFYVQKNIIFNVRWFDDINKYLGLPDWLKLFL